MTSKAISLLKKIEPLTEQIDETKITEQETGLQDDCYAGEVEVALRPEQRQERIRKYVHQEEQRTTVVEVYPQAINMTDTDLQELKVFGEDNDPEKIVSKRMLVLLDRFMWFHVQMPTHFGYTGAIQANNAFQGLEHSFVRHWDDWLQYIPGLKNRWHQLLDHILRLIEKVRDAKNPTESAIAIEELNDAIKQLPNETYIIVRLALLDIQVKVLEFLRRNVSSAHYLEHGVNERARIQVYFEVIDSNGETGVMVVCVSDQLFPSVHEFGDERPVRTITTVFFKTWKEYINSKIRSGKPWLEN